jgi:hypothetical protein
LPVSLIDAPRPLPGRAQTRTGAEPRPARAAGHHPNLMRNNMSTIDLRGAIVNASDPPIGTNPNPDLAWKAPVLVATTGANITLSGVQAIDGITVGNNNERVLVKDQADPTTNGFYNAATGPWTRTVDAANNSQFATGLQVVVTNGTVNGGKTYELTSPNPITLGTSALTLATLGIVSPFTGDSGSGGAAGAVPAPSAGQGAIDAVLKASGAFAVVGWTNVRLAKTAAYALANTDKGKTIGLGGSAFYALTLNAASGYDADFVAVLVNEDSGRAKSVVVTGGTSFTLWPGQVATMFNDNNAWRVLGLPGRYTLTASTTLYCDVVNGNDSNDGLAAGTGNAFKTIQHACDTVINLLDLGGQYNLTIQLADGTYPENVNLGMYVGRGREGHTGPVAINGDSVTPANVIVQPASGAAFTGSECGMMEWEIGNLQINTTGGQAVYADAGAWIVLQSGIIFGGTSSIHMQANDGGFIEVHGNYTIAAGAQTHITAGLNGEVLYKTGLTVTLTGTPAFSVAFAQCQLNGIIEASSVTWSGSATGVRYTAATGGGIDTSGGGANYFPGNSAGSATSPGWYN